MISSNYCFMLLDGEGGDRHTDDLVTLRVLDMLPISVSQDYKGRPKIVLRDCEGLPTKV